MNTNKKRLLQNFTNFIVQEKFCPIQEDCTLFPRTIRIRSTSIFRYIVLLVRQSTFASCIYKSLFLGTICRWWNYRMFCFHAEFFGNIPSLSFFHHWFRAKYAEHVIYAYQCKCSCMKFRSLKHMRNTTYLCDRVHAKMWFHYIRN